MTTETFTARCTEDKFFAMRDCFDDVCENVERFDDTTVTTTDERFDRDSVTFTVRTDDAFSMEFARHMQTTWNR